MVNFIYLLPAEVRLSESENAPPPYSILPEYSERPDPKYDHACYFQHGTLQNCLPYLHMALTTMPENFLPTLGSYLIRPNSSGLEIGAIAFSLSCMAVFTPIIIHAITPPPLTQQTLLKISQQTEQTPIPSYSIQR